MDFPPNDNIPITAQISRAKKDAEANFKKIIWFNNMIVQTYVMKHTKSIVRFVDLVNDKTDDMFFFRCESDDIMQPNIPQPIQDALTTIHNCIYYVRKPSGYDMTLLNQTYTWLKQAGVKMDQTEN